MHFSTFKNQNAFELPNKRFGDWEFSKSSRIGVNYLKYEKKKTE